MHYTAPADTSKTSLDRETIDLFFSSAVFEHAPVANIKAITIAFELRIPNVYSMKVDFKIVSRPQGRCSAKHAARPAFFSSYHGKIWLRIV